MARQKGALKYVGTIGDIRHFRIKGNKGYFAGMVGGPTAEQIATDPAFKRTRENMNEFAGSATTGKSFRNGISGLIKSNGDSQVTGRITAIMKKINLEDGSEVRGKRAVLITQVPHYLVGFEFNKFTSFGGVFKAPFTLTPTAGRDSSTLEVASFNPLDSLYVPAGATHFRLLNVLTVVSDFAYNETTKVYEPKDGTVNELTAAESSDYISVSEPTALISLASTLPGSPVLSTDVSVVNVLAIEFYQEVNGNYYQFSQGNAMKVAAVY